MVSRKTVRDKHHRQEDECHDQMCELQAPDTTFREDFELVVKTDQLPVKHAIMHQIGTILFRRSSGFV